MVGALKDDQHQVADRRTGLPVERARVAGPAGTNCDLKRRVTMLRDQTTRSKLAARQPNGRNPDRLTPHFLPLKNQQSGSDCRDSRARPDRLIHGCDRYG